MTSTQGEIHFAAPSIKIGKHEWRQVVYSDVYYGRRCTAHQFRPLGDTHWRDETEWPKYDSNDSYLGLPRSLGGKYWRNHQDSISAALNA